MAGGSLVPYPLSKSLEEGAEVYSASTSMEKLEVGLGARLDIFCIVYAHEVCLEQHCTILVFLVHVLPLM